MRTVFSQGQEKEQKILLGLNSYWLYSVDWGGTVRKSLLEGTLSDGQAAAKPLQEENRIGERLQLVKVQLLVRGFLTGY